MPGEKIVTEIESADIGLIPNIPSTHWDLAFPTRIFEYLCMDKPVIAPRTRGILDYFSEDSLYFFIPGSAEDLSRVILALYQNPYRTRAVQSRATAVYQGHTWEIQKKHFIGLVQHLVHVHDSETRKPIDISENK